MDTAGVLLEEQDGRACIVTVNSATEVRCSLCILRHTIEGKAGQGFFPELFVLNITELNLYLQDSLNKSGQVYSEDCKCGMPSPWRFDQVRIK